MKFLVCRKQEGEGCDYTIGCGMRFDVIEADSLNAAVDRIVWPDGQDECSSLEGEFALVKILAVPFDEVHIVDVEGYKSAIAKVRDDERKAAAEAAEKEELARLKRKYDHS